MDRQRDDLVQVKIFKSGLEIYRNKTAIIVKYALRSNLYCTVSKLATFKFMRPILSFYLWAFIIAAKL